MCLNRCDWALKSILTIARIFIEEEVNKNLFIAGVFSFSIEASETWLTSKEMRLSCGGVSGSSPD